MKKKGLPFNCPKKRKPSLLPIPLDFCAGKGDLETVKLLLDTGVNVNAKNSRGSNALIGASWTGKQEIVSYLLGVKADVNLAPSGQSTALTAAVIQKHEPIALLLLERRDNPNIVEASVITPPIIAAWQGSLALVKALLTKGANAKYIRPDNGQTALKMAAAAKNADMVKALKAAGATE